eukprot:snap_masked-scaffold_41-processed-gene-0.3-mRNA-1 protein AED:1.00 eAED:1.00 QI:0/0/0/0/1/1/2/0/86
MRHSSMLILFGLVSILPSADTTFGFGLDRVILEFEATLELRKHLQTEAFINKEIDEGLNTCELMTIKYEHVPLLLTDFMMKNKNNI